MWRALADVGTGSSPPLSGEQLMQFDVVCGSFPTSEFQGRFIHCLVASDSPSGSSAKSTPHGSST